MTADAVRGTAARRQVDVHVFLLAGQPPGTTAAEALAAAGFDASSGGNAAATDVTTVSAATGDEALAAAVAAEVPGAAVTVDDSLASGTVQLVLGADSNGIGQPVSAKAPETAPGTYASSERTAEDTSCIA